LDGGAQEAAKTIADLRLQLDGGAATIADLQARLAAEAKSAADLRAQLDGGAATIADLEAKLAAETKSAADLRAQLDAGATTIADLEAKLAAEAKSAADLRAQLDGGATTIADLEAKLAAETKSAADLRAQALEAAKTIADLQAQLGGITTSLTASEQTAEELRAQLDRHRQASTDALIAKNAEIEALKNREPEIRVMEKIIEVEKPPAPAPAAETAAPPEFQLEPDRVRDNLKLIHGIGPVLEKRLNSLGVFLFEQVGRWTEADIDTFQSHLPEFQGRIRRDKWVDSAREQYRKKYGKPLV
jgi:predicted flap endonuclease-1-like 5' DNA nuclease